MPEEHNNKNTAYSLLTVEKFYNSDTDDSRIIEGIATTPTPDRSKDVVESEGIQFKNPLPLLLHHDHKSPVGEVYFSKATKDGIRFTAKIAKIEEEGALKSRCDEAWQSVKAGLIRGVSVGFRPIDVDILKSGGLHFKSSEVFELSLVVVPCNAEASILSVKEYDVDQTDVKSVEHVEDVQEIEEEVKEVFEKTINTSVAPNNNNNIDIENNNNKGNKVMSLSEQIKNFEDKLKQLNERLDTTVAKSMSEARTLDDSEAKEYDEVVGEIKGVKSHLERLKEMESLAGARAATVETKSENQPVSMSFGAQPKSTTSQEKGLGLAKFAKIIGQSRGNLLQAEHIAKSCGDVRVYNAISKAASMGTSTSTDYSALVEYQTLESEFIELLRPATIVGQINGFRDIPFNVRITGQSGATSVGWVGEGQVKPSTGAAFNSTEHGWKKNAGIVVLSEELLRDSSPSADRLIRDDLVRTISQEVDAQFILPGRAGNANAPDPITAGVTAVASTGSTSAALTADISALFANMLTANVSYNGSVIVMSEVQAMRIGMLRNDLGQVEYPSMSGDVKTLFGVRVITSEAVGNNIVLLKPSEIYMSRGAVTIDSSNQATITLESGPVNLYETNSVAIRAEQYINWSRRRDAAVQLITGANYSGVNPTV